MTRPETPGGRDRRPPKPTASPPVAFDPSFVPPYAPSWVDRLIRWVDRLPGPYWAYYLAAFVGVNLALAAAHWSAGWYRPWSFDRVHVLMAAGMPLLFLVMTYFNQAVVRALEDFRAAFLDTSAEFQAYDYRLTTLPAWPALAAGVSFGGGVVIIAGIDPALPSRLTSMTIPSRLLHALLLAFDISPQPVPAALGLSLAALSWLAMGAFAYQLLRQLRMISEIYTHHSRVDLFELSPLYSLSRHTARVSITILIFNGLLSGLYPDIYASVGSLIILGLFLAVLAASFLLPQLGVHRLLEKEKERMIAENGAMLKAAIADLHRRVTRRRLGGMDDLNKTMASLEIERAALMRIPTWPWAPETLRTVVAALLFPIVVWVTQQILGGALGG